MSNGYTQKNNIFVLCAMYQKRSRLSMAQEMLLNAADHDLRAPLSSVGIGLAIIGAGKRGPVSDSTTKMISSIEHIASQLKDSDSTTTYS